MSDYGYGSNRYKNKSNSNVNISDKNRMEVGLTPIGYLAENDAAKREEMLEKSNISKIYLKVIHEKSNNFDNKALKVYCDDNSIGYIQKRFPDKDLTYGIEKFCFSENALKNIEMECHNKVYTIFEKKSADRAVNTMKKSSKVEGGNVASDNTIDTKKEIQHSLKALIEKTGWKLK